MGGEQGAWEAIGYVVDDDLPYEIPQILRAALRRKDRPDKIRPMTFLGEEGSPNIIDAARFEIMVRRNTAVQFEARDWNDDSVLYLAEYSREPEQTVLSIAEERLKAFVEKARQKGYVHLAAWELDEALETFDHARRISNEVDDYVRVCALAKPFTKGLLRDWLKAHAPNLDFDQRVRELGVIPGRSRGA